MLDNLKVALGICTFGVCVIGGVTLGILSLMALFSAYFWLVPFTFLGAVACVTVCVTLFKKVEHHF